MKRLSWIEERNACTCKANHKLFPYEDVYYNTIKSLQKLLYTRHQTKKMPPLFTVVKCKKILTLNIAPLSQRDKSDCNGYV